MQDQGDISITIRPVLSARARAKKYRSIQPYINGNPRKEVASLRGERNLSFRSLLDRAPTPVQASPESRLPYMVISVVARNAPMREVRHG
jgi:hypothetical protein